MIEVLLFEIVLGLIPYIGLGEESNVLVLSSGEMNQENFGS